jgi:hypothetical protein
MATTLAPTQRYAAGALLALALRQAQIHQSAPLGGTEADDEERASSASSSASSDAASDADLWTHDSRGLLRPVFRSAPAGRLSPEMSAFVHWLNSRDRLLLGS